MPDPEQALTFLSWVRDRPSELATGQDGGRAAAAASVTLTARGADGAVSRSETRTLGFAFAGPADVIGLGPGAVVRRYPAPDAPDHESDRCPYVELAEPSLPWRYTPTVTPATTDASLHPWLVLLVGEEGTELTLVDNRVTIAVSAQGGEHTLGLPASPHRFAHVQVDAAGHRTARVLCGRPLQPGTDYLAVLVPAFDATGARSWTGAPAVTVPAYDAWRFRTAVPAGSFEDLAARLGPGDAPPATGRALLHYPRLDDAPDMEMLGALVAVTPAGPVTEDSVPPAVEADLAQLNLPARDPEGRPIVTLPRYGDVWDRAAADGAPWGRDLNRDPRHRGVAGLGLEVGIRFQEELVSDALAHLGALAEARQRVRNAVMGVEASRALWRRRVPAEPSERLWLLGPSLARLTTPSGTVGDQATAEDRTVARGTFSAAARRVLREGPARTALAESPPTPAAVLDAANREPPPLPARADGLPLDRIPLGVFERARTRALQTGPVPPATLLAAATDAVATTDARVRRVAGEMVTAIRQAAQAGRPVPWTQALGTIAAADAAVVGSSRAPAAAAARLSAELTDLRQRLTDRADAGDLADLLGHLAPLDANEPAVRPVAVDALATSVSAAFDPTRDDAPVLVRVLSTIDGVDADQPVAPPEPCVGLDRATWADLARIATEWLLPGVGQLPDNSVVSLETNPVFTDAFLAGLNTQLLTELRWRNIPVATACTPIRRFWDRADTTAGTRADDIVGLAAWSNDSTLGDAAHLAPGASARELVIAVRGQLFVRYPTTLVYLKSARHGGATTADFDVDPDDDVPRVLPGFQGRLGADVAFFGFPGVEAASVADHWLVFEEPPSGYRFANDVAPNTATGHEWAAATLAQPVRVLIRGDALMAGHA